jgi:Tol biopolymer transport system component
LSWGNRGYAVSRVLAAAAASAAIGLAADSVAAFQPAEDLPREPKSAAIEPLSVRPLMPVEAGRNDSNPVWSPSGVLIAFERSRGDRKGIVIARPNGVVVQDIYFQLSENGREPKFFFPGVVDDVSYNAGITWSPTGDRLVFMSNGGAGNYDLYLRELDRRTVRLTDHKEKDGQAHWSPVADQLVFVSGRTGKGDIYLLDVATRAVTQLTWGSKPYLYPQWSPDGKRIVVLHGSNENHNIYLIEDVRRPGETLRALTAWNYDDLRPVWSPDGRKIAFYSNYNPTGDSKAWAILVIAADGSDPVQGEALAAKVVATDVIPDVERGPAWMPDSNRIVYVRNDRQEYNPIYIADLVQKTNVLLKTETKMNHDVACSTQGVIAFRAQVDQWDQIFLARLRD